MSRQSRPACALLVASLTIVLTLLAADPAPGGVLPPTNPTWPATYNLSLSTISMSCNSTGWSPPELGAQFGIVSYDWSNAKAQWAAAKPMDCEQRLREQARMTKAKNPATRVFVYSNIIKALPWFASVREKLDDPAFAGWFLKFDPQRLASNTTAVPPCATEDPKKCSVFYHDQGQTPAVPSATNRRPDGACTDGVCDCGTQPCGEYLYDHRNSSLRDFIVNEIIGGPYGLGDPAISGFFLDDGWCSDKVCQQRGCPHDAGYGCAGCKCAHGQGASEENARQMLDMGLTRSMLRRKQLRIQSF